jgi:hypothetical protein
MPDGISPNRHQALERMADRFVRKFDANENGQIDPKERRHEHLFGEAVTQPTFAIDGSNFMMQNISKVKVDVLDGMLVDEADFNGDKSATGKELVDSFLKKHDGNGDGVTTKAELKADGANSKRAFRQHLKSHVSETETTRYNMSMGRLSGS